MIDTAPDMKLRISVHLRRKIEDAARRNNRTMNGEIAARLEWSFEAEAQGENRGENDFALLEATVRLLMNGLEELRGDVRALQEK